MATAAIGPAAIGSATSRGQVLAWAMWDWGSAAFSAVIVTFVFSVYLTDSVGADLPGSVSASSWLGWALGASGLLIAVLAPVTGQRSDATGHRKRSLALLTGAVVVAMTAMSLVQDRYQYLWLGLTLLGAATVLFELAQVPYSAMLRQVSTPQNIGRVSGFGWAMGYFGGIALLLICYFGFIAGDGDARGLLGVSTDGGLNIRLVVLLAAVWFAAFAIPVLLAVPELPRAQVQTFSGGASGNSAEQIGFLGSYRVLWRDLRELWDADRHTVYYLGASALFRDGLAGVFTFGAVLAVNVYGIATADVLLFGVAANVVAAAGALAAGRFDDRMGPKPVIVGSLIAMLGAGAVLLVVSGPFAFWVLGLVLCLFVGPAQSAARTFLARITLPGREGQMFGLYATTGRAASFLAPTLFGLCAWLFGSDRAGILGLLIVLAVGLAALLPVRPPRPGYLLLAPSSD